VHVQKIKKAMHDDKEKMAIYNSRRDASPEANPPGTLTLEFQQPKL
jgi:hypothetical protein